MPVFHAGTGRGNVIEADQLALTVLGKLTKSVLTEERI